MISSFNEYQQLAGETDIIKAECRLSYYPLGLNGEAGEVAEKIAANYMSYSSENRESIALELGDVMWYIARLSAHLGYDLSFVADGEDEPTHYQMNKTSGLFENYTDTIPKCTLCISAYAGRVADTVKKIIRDSGGIVSDSHKESVAESLKMVMRHTVALSAFFGYPICQTLQMNIDKLNSRKERNKLSGNGDYR